MAERYTSDTALFSIAVKGTNVLYGFRTYVDATVNAILGHVSAFDANGKLNNGVILGANSPKPPRATKKRVSGRSDSSFISTDKIADAKAAGWKISAGSITVPRATPLSVPVFVSIDSGSGESAINYKYGWRMPRYQYAEIADELGVLGIELVTNENYNEVWFGVNQPKPKRASKDLTGDSTITTFVSSAREESVGTTTGATPAPSGWYLSGSKKSRVQFGL